MREDGMDRLRLLLQLTKIYTGFQTEYRPFRSIVIEANGEDTGEVLNLLLGRALGSVSSNPALIWMFLSGNANVKLGRKSA
jgi:hypothetical protein